MKISDVFSLFCLIHNSIDKHNISCFRNKNIICFIITIMNVCLFILNIFGAIMFWNLMDISNCDRELYNYIFILLIIKFCLNVINVFQSKINIYFFYI